MLEWDWAFTWTILPRLAAALQVTVAATAGGSALALSLGLVLALLRRSRRWPVRTAADGFVQFVRSTPLLIQIYFLFYVMPQFGLRLSPLVTGVVALGLHYGTYASEVYRAGMDA